MSRDISPDVSVDGLNLRLDMTALFDFEHRADMTVSEFLSPVIDILQGDEFGAMDGVPEDERNRMGLGLLRKVLASGVIAAKNLLILVWAMAGGEDLDEGLREFGRRINWENRAEIAAAILQAIKQSQPEKSDDDEEETGDEDPTPRPELLTTGQ